MGSRVNLNVGAGMVLTHPLLVLVVGITTFCHGQTEMPSRAKTMSDILDLNSQSRSDPMDFFFMSNRGKRSDLQDEEEDLDFQRTLRKLMVSRPHSLFLYRPDMVKRLLAKRGGNFQRPNGLLISMGKRISPLGFNNPLLNKLLKEMENKPKRSGDDVFDT